VKPGAHGPVPNRRYWTDQRIEKELRSFLAHQLGWPGPRAFELAGKSSLYLAASENGGIASWRRRLGR
jgi:hypothetical protein